jgi:chromosome segregation ATPase
MNRQLTQTALVCLVLGGCATSYEQCDPNKESFLGAANCMMSTEYGYAGRQARLEGELAEQQELNRAFQQLAASIEQEKQRVRGELASKQADYAALDGSWQALQARLQQRSVENKALAAQIERMEEKMNAINQAGSKPPEDREKLLNDLRRQAAILQQELEAGLY